MSSPSNGSPPGGPAHPPTQEIPVVPPAQLPTQQFAPAAGGSTAVATAAPAPAAGDGVQGTGPVGFVPGLPGAGTPPPTAPQARPRRRHDRTALAGLGLGGLSVLLLELGLGLDVAGTSLWSATPLWSGFATLCALLGLLALAASYLTPDRLRPASARRAAAGGLAGLAVFWVLIVLPTVDTDRGFVLTAALACLAGAVRIGPRPRG